MEKSKHIISHCICGNEIKIDRDSMDSAVKSQGLDGNVGYATDIIYEKDKDDQINVFLAVAHSTRDLCNKCIACFLARAVVDTIKQLSDSDDASDSVIKVEYPDEQME